MKSSKLSAVLVLTLGLFLFLPNASEAEPMGTAFTYQGRLTDANAPADGLYDFWFELYDASSDGNQIGGAIYIIGFDIIDGDLTVELDFGQDPNIFNGDARWLQIYIRSEDSNDANFVTLSPRQQVTPTPYAMYAKTTAAGDNDWMVVGSNMYSIPPGKVGVGTTSPAEKLDVSGYINTSSAYKIRTDTVVSTTGTNNIFVGVDAGYSNVAGSSNTFLGERAGYYNTTGLRNTFLGDQAGLFNITGYSNTFVGTEAGYFNTIGNANTFLGEQAGFSTTTGFSNTFLGKQAGLYNTAGYRNTFVGREAGVANTTGYRNTFLGSYAGFSNISGHLNTFLGEQAGYSNTTGNANTFLGPQAGYLNTSGYYNTFLAERAGYSNTEGYSNTFVGREAGYSNTTGNSNTFLGLNAGTANTTGTANTFLGVNAGFSNTQGNSNTFLGLNAGRGNTTGSQNTFLGNEAGYNNQTGTRNVFIGNNSGYNETGSNKLYIANGPNDDDVLIYGDFSTDQVGIGDTSPDTGEETLTLDVDGAVGATRYCDENGNNCVTPLEMWAGFDPPNLDNEGWGDDSEGSVTLPNGLIMKWGKTTRDVIQTPVTFTIPFPAACFQVIACGGSATGDSSYDVATHTISRTGFTVRAQGFNSNPIRWFAVGR